MEKKNRMVETKGRKMKNVQEKNKNKGKDVKCGKRSSNKMSMMDDIKRKKEVGENETEIKKKNITRRNMR